MPVEPPGPESRAASSRLRELEAPGVNTLYGDADNLLWLEAKGANVLDVDGNRYIDLTSGFGVAVVGHRHPKVVRAIRDQSGRLIHGLGDAAGHPWRIRLADELRRLSKIDDAQTYFAISGADAVEVALKTALLWQRRSGDYKERQTLIAFEPAYHGLTLGALALSSRPEFRGPFDAHLTPELRRLPFACSARSIESALERRDVAAVIVEPIVGREGVLVPPDGWLAGLAHQCRRAGTLLITDEIFTGFARTGTLFAAEYEQVRPDLLVCGKALAGGLPIGAVIGRKELMAAWTTPGEALHTATFIANPLACASALAALEVIEQQDLCGRAKELGLKVHQRLDTWPERYAPIQAVRGRGLLWGLELDHARSAAALSQAARRRGLLMLAGGPRGNVAQIVPPLTITERQLEHALDTLEDAMDHALDQK